MTELEKHIQHYFGITKEDLTAISSFFKPLTLKKGEYFLKTGRYSERLGFVQSGILREYLSVEGKEVTKWISTPGYFVVDLASFLFQQTARWNIQALSDCELYVIRKKSINRSDKQCNSGRNWKNYFSQNALRYWKSG